MLACLAPEEMQSIWRNFFFFFFAGNVQRGDRGEKKVIAIDGVQRFVCNASVNS